MLQIINQRRAAIFIDCDKVKLNEAISADICIIGSGPAALALARSLAASNATVVMIERGGITARAPNRNVHFKSRPYDGIHNGIAFGYGGTGALWGGQLLPMLESELANLGAPWNSEHFSEELRKHYQTIESWVGVTSTPYDETLLKIIDHNARQLRWRSITPLFSKWIPFRRRNLGASWMGLLHRSNNIKALLNLQPADWISTEAGGKKTIQKVVCRSQNGLPVEVEAKHFVIAAGALDSPLILEKMLGDEAAKKLGVGQMLHDHLSLRVAEITDYSRNEFEKLFTPFFTGNTMRSLRLCLPDEPHQEHPPSNWAYCHFVVEAPSDSGFAVARDLLRGLQAKNYTSAFKALLKTPSAMGDIARMAWMRLAKGRLSLSKGSKIFIHIDFVQSQSSGNKITLQKGLNSDVIEVDWSINEDINSQISRALNMLDSFWKENNLQQVGKLTPIDYGNNHERAINNLYDIYHPAGTCSIGRVVDTDLKIFGLTNGYVVGSSVFPKLGRSNPTFTIMALSLRLGALLSSLSDSDSSHR